MADDVLAKAWSRLDLALKDADATEAKAEARRVGRPRNSSPRATARPVKLDTDVDDALCRMSRRHDVSIHALLKLAARMLVECEPAVLVKRLP